MGAAGPQRLLCRGGCAGRAQMAAAGPPHGTGRGSGWSPASRRGRRAASGAGPREAAASSETIAAAGAAALMGLGADVKLPY